MWQPIEIVGMSAFVIACTFVIIKTMCDYIIRRVVEHMELRGLFDKPEVRNDPEVDEVIDRWTSNMPIVDNGWDTARSNTVDAFLTFNMSATHEDGTSSFWEDVTVRTDVVRCHENVIGESVMKAKRWEKERGS